MSIKNNFRIIQEYAISELRSKALWYEHITTGAQVLSLINDDENKTFGIAFRTPPPDSSGVAHIIEHSLLCGSRKYPVKDVLTQLMGSSVKTFINAFTYPDKTVFPVASQNLKDFYNLVDIYLDTVFYPHLSKETFMQEAWHLELDNNNNLFYKGVVLNEMKGSYSDGERIATKKVLESLFPNTTYSVDSGGDPHTIPHLSYEQFKQFHSTYYHPSNAYIYFYGNDNPKKRLEIAHEYLKKFNKKGTDSEIALQARFTQPVYINDIYPASEQDKEKGIVSVNWMINELPELKDRLAWEALGYMLAGTPAGLLRKPLIDSHVGDDFISLLDPEDSLRQLCFTVGLKGVKGAGDATKEFEKHVFLVLEEITKKGINTKDINAALNRIEFSLREIDGLTDYPFPRGLNLFERALATWLHGGNPISTIAFEKPLQELKNDIQNTVGYFEHMIQNGLMNNTHRTVVTLEPDTQYSKRSNEQEQTKLRELQERMSNEQKEYIRSETAKLHFWQQSPDTPEALNTIPLLHITDLPKKIREIPIEVSEKKGAEVLFHAIPTNGIVYVDIAFNLHVLPLHLVPYVTTFGKAVLEMGTEKENFVHINQRRDLHTGGISTSHLISLHRSTQKLVACMLIHGRSLIGKAENMLVLIRDMLLYMDVKNKERFKQIVTESKVHLEASLISEGHVVVHSRLKAQYSAPGWVAEQLSGIEQLLFLRSLIKRIDREWDVVQKDLQTIKELLITQRGLLINITTDAKNKGKIHSAIAHFLSAFPTTKAPLQAWDISFKKLNEGLTVPAQVNYVGKGANLYEFGYTYHGSVLGIVKFLKNGYLWDRIRVHGGAYGGFCAFDKATGVFNFLSYRDPNTVDTLKNYNGARGYLKTLSINTRELEKTIVSTIGDLDTYLLPNEKGYTSLVWYVIGETAEMRQKTRNEVFAMTAQDFTNFADMLSELNKKGTVSILGSKHVLEKMNKEENNLLTITEVL